MRSYYMKLYDNVINVIYGFMACFGIGIYKLLLCMGIFCVMYNEIEICPIFQQEVQWFRTKTSISMISG